MVEAPRVIFGEWDDHIRKDLLAGDTKLGEALELQGMMPGGPIVLSMVEDDGGCSGGRWLSEHGW